MTDPARDPHRLRQALNRAADDFVLMCFALSDVTEESVGDLLQQSALAARARLVERGLLEEEDVDE